MSVKDNMVENKEESPVTEESPGDDYKGETEPPKEGGEGKEGDATMENGDDEEKTKEQEGEQSKDEGEGETEEKKKPKIDPKDWPLRDIKEPCDNDVLFGRGGGTNHAKGNKRYRKMVEDRKLEYVNSKRLDKPLVALEIIRLWRAQDPPGRFLKQESNGLWTDVGDKKAREKTSQALREKAPLIRKQQEEERHGKDGDAEHSGDEKDKEQSTKTTRFAEGTNTESKGGIKKAVLARDHSLGREYLQAGETMNLEGFSWREPLDSQRSGSQGSLPPPPLPPGEYPSPRVSSGSLGMPPPPEYRVPSQGPPPAQGYFHRTPTEEYSRQNYQNPPMMPGYAGYGPHQRSGSWTHSPAHAMPPLREHSLSQNPLRNASVGHSAPLNAFVESGRSGSGYWGDPSMRPPPPGPQSYPGHYREGSGTYPPPPPRDYNQGREYNQNGGPAPIMQPPPAVTAAPPYAVDPAIARTWSSHSDEDISRMVDKDYGGRDATQQQQQQQPSYEQTGFDHDRQDQSHLPRPQIVKRMTSNQNETFETKKDLIGPSVKRAALNRDNSLASNRLKAAHLPEYYNQNGKFDDEREMSTLTDNFEQSTLGSEKPKQKSMGSSERTSTLDNVAMDIMARPAALTENSRTSTVEALALDDLESDPVIGPDNGGSRNIPKPSALSSKNRLSTMEACFAELEEVTAKPLALTGTDRVSTRDYLDIGDEPLTEIDIDRMYEDGE